jgi:hypothetical protein
VATANIGSTSSFNLGTTYSQQGLACPGSGAVLSRCGCQTDDQGDLNYLYSFGLFRSQVQNISSMTAFSVRGYGPQTFNPDPEGALPNANIPRYNEGPYYPASPLYCCVDGKTLNNQKAGEIVTCLPDIVLNGDILNLPIPSIASAMADTIVNQQVMSAVYQFTLNRYCSPVTGIAVTNGGTGYSSNLASIIVTISGGGGNGATAAVGQVINGVIVGIYITPNENVYGGYDYTSPPTVTITGGNGTGATAVAFIGN